MVPDQRAACVCVCACVRVKSSSTGGTKHAANDGVLPLLLGCFPTPTASYRHKPTTSELWRKRRNSNTPTLQHVACVFFGGGGFGQLVGVCLARRRRQTLLLQVGQSARNAAAAHRQAERRQIDRALLSRSSRQKPLALRSRCTIPIGAFARHSFIYTAHDDSASPFLI